MPSPHAAFDVQNCKLQALCAQNEILVIRYDYSLEALHFRMSNPAYLLPLLFFPSRFQGVLCCPPELVFLQIPFPVLPTPHHFVLQICMSLLHLVLTVSSLDFISLCFRFCCPDHEASVQNYLPLAARPLKLRTQYFAYKGRCFLNPPLPFHPLSCKQTFGTIFISTEHLQLANACSFLKEPIQIHETLASLLTPFLGL